MSSTSSRQQTATTEAERARLRRNQRNSRARKAAYVNDLEKRWQECMEQGSQATQEMQRQKMLAVRECGVLRELLVEFGAPQQLVTDRVAKALQEEASNEMYLPYAASPAKAGAPFSPPSVSAAHKGRSVSFCDSPQPQDVPVPALQLQHSQQHLQQQQGQSQHQQQQQQQHQQQQNQQHQHQHQHLQQQERQQQHQRQQQQQYQQQQQHQQQQGLHLQRQHIQHHPLPVPSPVHAQSQQPQQRPNSTRKPSYAPSQRPVPPNTPAALAQPTRSPDPIKGSLSEAQRRQHPMAQDQWDVGRWLDQLTQIKDSYSVDFPAASAMAPDVFEYAAHGANEQVERFSFAGIALGTLGFVSAEEEDDS